ncbi:MAG: YcfL family protein [Phycisphaeraceae bacterium]|nr:YcfL family protein [Phycisphaeraceae bacterium]
MAKRRIQLIATLTLTGVLVGAVAGCQTVNTYEPNDPQAVVHTVNDKRVETDMSLINKAHMQSLITAHTPDGLLKVQAQLFNGTNKREKINYRFQWVDQDGMLIDTPLSTWKQVSLAGREKVMIQATAPSKNAVDFRLKLLEPKG